MDTRATERLVRGGETVAKTVRVSRDEIVAFARMSHDANPLHTDRQAAQRARFGEIIASGQHTAAILMGMLATHFSRSDDGVAREMLCLNMNFAFKEPVFADQDVLLQWRVVNVQWNNKLHGVLVHLDGNASVAHAKPAVVARGTLLVKECGA
ncbi:MAG TPA: MaoC family dehydratase [Albitalea sp.]|nr:MaoC family dehydratase [Albitalea sp.]